jgi:hypothetical protein
MGAIKPWQLLLCLLVTIAIVGLIGAAVVRLIKRR